MRVILLLIVLLHLGESYSQENVKTTNVNVRGSFLLAPFTPLLTIETVVTEKVTIQFESNFINTHGINVKHFLKNRMNGSFVFIGSAFISNQLLREDDKATLLPYAGYGYAHRFGNNKRWIFDSRAGLGKTSNADSNSVYPVIKTGLGLVF